ncbi:DUF6380 family protein [Streptomyces phaeochromogenes]
MDTLGQDDASPGKRRATLRSGTASLTSTADRALLDQHGQASGEGAR